MNLPKDTITSSFVDIRISLNLSTSFSLWKSVMISHNWEKNSFLVLEWKSQWTRKCSSSSTFPDLQYLHNLLSGGKLGFWCRPVISASRLAYVMGMRLTRMCFGFNERPVHTTCILTNYDKPSPVTGYRLWQSIMWNTFLLFCRHFS